MTRVNRNRNLLITVIILSILLLPYASSRTIYQINEIDILPQGDFENSDDWDLETQYGFTDSEAENTDLIVDGSQIRINHQREQNLKSMIFWSTESNSGHESSVGEPDGLLSVSSGADIDLSGFNFSTISNFPLVSSTLVISFRISNGLNDDRVEISISSEDSAYLLKSYSSTFSQGEINYLQSPYYLINIDEFNNWDWDSLSKSSIKLNYESVGGSDEAQLEVDAVALKVTYQMMDSGFDFVKAQTEISLDEDYEYGNLSLNVIGEITGTFGDLDEELSWIKFQIGSTIVYEMKINTISNFEINVDLGKDLFVFEENLIFAIGAQIYWDSDGSSSDGLIVIDEVKINGVTTTEWDENPQCLEFEDYIGENSFLEDSGDYVIIPLEESCSDDRTTTSELSYVITTTNEGIVRVEIDEGYLKIFQVANSFGITEINLDVFDALGNKWNDSFYVEVVGVNDPPVISEFPEEVWIELGDKLTLVGDFYDPESNVADLEISVDNNIGDLVNNILEITPTETGVFDITLTVGDGELSTSHGIRVNVFSEADLKPVSLEIIHEQGIINNVDNLYYSDWDSNVKIKTNIENLGALDATFISLRFYFNQELIQNTTIPLISANSSKTIEFDWDLTSLEGDYIIKVVVDSNNLIDESNELNNEFYLNFSVESNEGGNLSTESSSLISNFRILPLSLFFGTLILSLMLFFGPKKIKRIS